MYNEEHVKHRISEALLNEFMDILEDENIEYIDFDEADQTLWNATVSKVYTLFRFLIEMNR
jgi:hypothetical protein